MATTESQTPSWCSGFIALGAFSAAVSVMAAAYAAHGQSLNGSSPAMVQSAVHLMQFHALGLILVGILGNFKLLLYSGLVVTCFGLCSKDQDSQAATGHRIR